MLVSYKWLNQYLDLSGITADELADRMSLTGIEVEGVTRLSEGLKKIVTGDVLECVPHPDSDHLSICQVNVGEEEPYQIICGAPNIKAGVKVIVAMPGARIAGNVKIKKGKMRGQASNGMICSLQELGYEDSVIPKEVADGIFYMPEDAKVGESVFPYLEMDDEIIELSITPNRADALSIRGAAYEAGAIMNQKPAFKDEKLVEGDVPASEKITVSVADEKDAPSYQIRIIDNVKIKPSPQWLQNCLMNEGIRPINNVVDVTNYILLLFGQPLHAFDYSKLGSEEILVRRGNEGEKFFTLDGEERTLSPKNIVITNGKVPVALAGVMGGLDSEITETTTTVALEAALFDPVSIRRTSQHFNLRSESSSRFEKGINKATISEACDVAAAMIAKLAEGTVLKGAVTASSVETKDVHVAISLDRINGALGTELTEADVNKIFEALGFGYEARAGKYDISIPPRRWDIAIEADIVEEVARIYGYDNLPSTLPNGATVPGSLTKDQILRRKTRSFLEGAGLSEAISYALTTPEKATQFTLEKTNLIRLDWPMSEERSVLRQNLISSLLDDVAYNVARKNNNVALYEMGRIFRQENDPRKDLPEEINHLGLAVAGDWTVKSWGEAGEKADFYTIKGILDSLFDSFAVTDKITYQPTQEISEMHPGRTAKILLDGALLGFAGQVHPSIAKAYDVPETYVAEIDLQKLMAFEKETLVYQPVSKYPSVSRDIALLIDEKVGNAEITAQIKGTAGHFLTNIQLFDIYQGENIEAGKKSMAYRLTFVNPEATLTDEEISTSFSKVEKALTEKLGAVIR